jgi:hypothetical protein
MRTLIDHFEDLLGPIETGWQTNERGERTLFQVVRFGRGPVQDSITFATLGLSNAALTDPESGKRIRHELVITVPPTLSVSNVPGILQQAAEESLAAGRPYLCGEVIGPRGPLFEGTRMEALYVASPVYFPDSFAYFESPVLGTVVLAWLVPITAREARFVYERGWDAFEDKLVERDPDLVNIYRDEVPLGSRDERRRRGYP